MSLDEYDEDIRDPSDVMGPSEMIMDLMYYYMRLNAQPGSSPFMYEPKSMTGRWNGATPQTSASAHGKPSGKETLPGVFVPAAKKRRTRGKQTTENVNEPGKIPPSTIYCLRKLVVQEIHEKTQPVFQPSLNFSVNLENIAWRHRIQTFATEFAIPGATEQTNKLKDNGKSPLNLFGIPFSDVTFDNIQLRWGRFWPKDPSIKVPLCAKGAECAAVCIVASQGPLNQWLSPAEEELFQKTGKLPEMSNMCILCHREAAYKCYINGKDNTVGIDMSAVTRPFLPEFYNLINMPGGYKRQYMITVEDAPFIAAPIAKPSSLLTAEKASANVVGYSGWYVNQRELIYAPSESNPPPQSSLN